MAELFFIELLEACWGVTIFHCHPPHTGAAPAGCQLGLVQFSEQSPWYSPVELAQALSGNCESR